MADRNIATFYKLTKAVEEDESLLVEAKKRLKLNYDDLVPMCPHTEAVDRKSTLRGAGTTRRCLICGITDYASQGGTPGDEYDYGYPGYPDKNFWAGSEVTVVTDQEFDKTRRYHEWVVEGGKARKRFE